MILFMNKRRIKMISDITRFQVLMEEIAYLKNFIQKKDLKKIIMKYSKNAYGRYLSKLINK